MNHDDTPIWMVCRTCHLPLNSRHPFDGGAVTYQHPPRADTIYDHEPVPVPRDEVAHVVMECDFCSGPDVAWIYPTTAPIANILAVETRRETERDHDTMRDHTIVRQHITGHEELRRNDFSPDWTACDPCSRLIDRYDANALASRVAKLLPDHPRQGLLRALFKEFLRKKKAKRSAGPTG